MNIEAINEALRPFGLRAHTFETFHDESGPQFHLEGDMETPPLGLVKGPSMREFCDVGDFIALPGLGITDALVLGFVETPNSQEAILLRTNGRITHLFGLVNPTKRPGDLPSERAIQRGFDYMREHKLFSPGVPELAAKARMDMRKLQDELEAAPEGVVDVSAPECTCHQPWNFGHADDCKWKEAQSCSDE